MTDIKEEPIKAGYTFDPYKDEGAECDDIISHLFEPMTGRGGLFSTWRERHIAIAGASAGFRAGTFSNVPDCPPLWQDEAQYFNGMAMVINVVKCQWPTILVVLGLLGAKTVTGA